MIKLLDFMTCTGIVLAEVLFALIVAFIVQAIFYRVFKINLYKIIYKINKLSIYRPNCFNFINKFKN